MKCKEEKYSRLERKLWQTRVMVLRKLSGEYTSEDTLRAKLEGQVSGWGGSLVVLRIQREHRNGNYTIKLDSTFTDYMDGIQLRRNS